MSIFNLPDLGEGLPDAEIHEWYVKEGDEVKVDQPLVSMETAKAVVDVPSPQDGIIAKLYGKPGDVMKTGTALVGFVSEAKPADKGTVVGHLEENHEHREDHFTIGATQGGSSNRTKSTPLVRNLAKKLGLDLEKLIGTGPRGLITREDVEKAASSSAETPAAGYEPLKGVRRAMLNAMNQSHQEVVPVSIFDEVDIEAWTSENDISARLIRAMVHAAQKEPALNAWFDTKTSSRKCFEEVHIGLAMDTDDGLFVPVIHHAEKKNTKELRAIINQFKTEVTNRAVSKDNLKGSTMTLSNFGKFAGRFASPIIVPPSVAILAVGRLYQALVPVAEKTENHRFLPLSLSFDHRAVTGGEATRFLREVMLDLSKEI